MTPLQRAAGELPALGRRPAVGLRDSFGARWWSYEQLDRNAHGFSEVLAQHNVSPRATVMLWAANSPEWVAAALGCLLRGVVVVPVDASSSPQATGRIADLVDPVLIVHDDEQDVSGLRAPCMPLTDALEAAATSSGEGPLDVATVGADDAAFVLFTSGTTSEPRGVVLTHRNLAVQMAAFRRWRPLVRVFGCRLLALSPLSHAQGLVMAMLVPLALGMSVLYSRSVAPAHVARVLRDNRVNLLLAVPGVQHVLVEWLRHAPSGRRRVPVGTRVEGIESFPLRRHLLFLATRRMVGYSFWGLLVGGATLAPEDERFWYEAGFVLVQGYGLTETSALVSYKVNGPFFARLGSIGSALPGQEVRLGPGGEVLVRGANVSPRLWSEAGATPGVATDGFFHTGDLARRGPGGRLYFRGRRSDVIVPSEGINVHAADVEAALRRTSGVRDAVVADVPRGGRSQVHAVLLLERGTDAARAVHGANLLLEPHQRIHDWSVWPGADFPRTNLLKVRRAEVVSAVTTGAPLAPAGAEAPAEAAGRAPVTPEDIRCAGDRQQRLHLLAQYVVNGRSESPPETGTAVPLAKAFGLSSLDAAELVTLIEQASPRPIEGIRLSADASLADLRSLVRDETGPAPTHDGRGMRLPTRQPRWSSGAPGRVVRRLTQPALVGGWSRSCVRTRVVWPAGGPIEPPCMLVVAPHRHWLDGFVVQSVLPRGWRTLTVTNRVFSEHFQPDGSTAARTRIQVALAYYVLWPLSFSFVILPNYGSTREGLSELGRWIDRGYSPITFPKGLAPPGRPNPRHEPGIAVMALQTRVPIVPVWLSGNDDLRLGPRRNPPVVTVTIGAPIGAGVRRAPEELIAEVETAFDHLAVHTGQAAP